MSAFLKGAVVGAGLYVLASWAATGSDVAFQGAVMLVCFLPVLAGAAVVRASR